MPPWTLSTGVRTRTIARPGGSGDLIDAEGHAFAAYHAVDGTDILVRPDGYLGERIS
ncbi:hypothetical protein [Nocardia panacis]|uniref:hypothetical protein n=1 Tax=Nocardia panacis TaxID=2340916 RepID=UPI001EF0907E|nr:hypothetical protein [Nocardia panacis]